VVPGAVPMGLSDMASNPQSARKAPSMKIGPLPGRSG
jgi:hypothetical protein